MHLINSPGEASVSGMNRVSSHIAMEIGDGEAAHTSENIVHSNNSASDEHHAGERPDTSHGNPSDCSNSPPRPVIDNADEAEILRTIISSMLDHVEKTVILKEKAGEKNSSASERFGGDISTKPRMRSVTHVTGESVLSFLYLPNDM